MYEAAEYLTSDVRSIIILQPEAKCDKLVAEFTIDKARQIDVVDKIRKEFSYRVENYSQSSISFPAKPIKKKRK